jgi:acetyl esterase/lipase
VPTGFLIASSVGLFFVLNALRPIPGMLLSVPSFFAAWLTAELAPQLLVIHVGGTVAFIVVGSAHGVQGYLALGFALLIVAGFAQLISEAQRARGVLEDALKESLGEGYAAKIRRHRVASYDLRVPWRQLILPFRMRHPDVERIPNLAYADVKRRNLIDVYRNRSRPTGCPILIYVHGGGWSTVSNKDHQGKPLMLHLVSRGWLCFAPNYRLSPRATFPDHIVDVKKAIAWVRENAERFGGNPNFIVLAGGSAGGHLSALAALTQNDAEYQPGFEAADTSVDACVPFYGVYDFTNEIDLPAARGRTMFLEKMILKRSIAEHREDFEKASPLFRIRPDAPPFFAIHGEHDSLVPVGEARHFVQKLRGISQSPVVYAELPGAQHAFDVFPSIRTAHVIRAVERFLDYVWSTEERNEERPSQAALPSDQNS